MEILNEHRESEVAIVSIDQTRTQEITSEHREGEVTVFANNATPEVHLTTRRDEAKATVNENSRSIIVVAENIETVKEVAERSDLLDDVITSLPQIMQAANAAEIAEQAKLEAISAKNEALESKETAVASAETALSSSSIALESANKAQESASLADQSAQSALTSKESASTSAKSASESMTQAKQSAQSASASASVASEKETLVKEYATRAETASADAENAKANAISAAERAERASNEVEGKLDEKQDKLTAGEGITIEGNVISTTDGGSASTSDSIKNQNIEETAVQPLYNWMGTKAEYDEQNIAELHPEWICFITDDYVEPVVSVNGQTGEVVIDVPTKTSELTNDSGFITAEDLPESGAFDFQGTEAEFNAAVEAGEITNDTVSLVTDDNSGELVATKAELTAVDASKADTALSNVLANIDYVVESKFPTADDPTWYRKYKSGWLEQGGLIPSQSWTANQTHTFELVKPFVDTNYTGFTTPSGTNLYAPTFTFTADTTTSWKSTQSAISNVAITCALNWRAEGQGA